MLSVPNLQIRLVWLDSDMIELRLCASSEDFCGCANFYAGFSEPSDFAAMLDGFPTGPADVRTAEFGQANLPGYGGAKIRFFCRDTSGHLVVEVAVFSAPQGPKDLTQSAVVQIDAVPAEIDSFSEQLRRLGSQVGATARLKDAS